MTQRPSGTVTFLFTDVVGSTRLWAGEPESMSRALELHDTELRAVIDDHQGYVFSTAGDAFATAFSAADDAVDCAVAIQQRLAGLDWPTSRPLRIRIGLHAGAAVERDGDYFGPVLNTAARVESAGQPGQILATAAIRELASREMRSLGAHALRDLPEPIELFQVGDGEFDPPRSLDRLTSTLPVMGNRLIGRRDEVADVRRLLRAARLVTLTGVGGSGKTRLAIEVGGRELPECEAVFFTDFTAVMNADDVDSAVVTGMGLTLSSGVEPLVGMLDYLRTRDVLLILDNCEHLLDPIADLTEEILGRCPGVRVLATSREALDIDGEHTWRVPSLGSDEGGPGFQLFVERASERDASFTVDANQRAAVEQICAGLDGLPLAIELAAARTLSMPVEEIRDRLDDRFQLLTGGRRQRSRQRQRTLASVVQWSHDLLDEDERRLLRRLAVFVGGFDTADVGPVTGFDDYEALDLVESLIGKSLIDSGKLQNGRPRHRLLETIRLYAREQLIAAGELDAMRDAHRDQFLGNPLHETSMGNTADPIALQRQMVEFDNICAAIDRAVETGRILEGALGVARNVASMNATGTGARYIDLVEDAVAEGNPTEKAALGLFRINTIFAGFADAFAQHELRNAPAEDLYQMFADGFINVDVLAGISMAVHVDVDATVEGVMPYLVAAEAHSDIAAGAMNWAMGAQYVREDRLDEAIATYRRALQLLPSARPGAMSGYELTLLLAASGHHDQAVEVANSLEPVTGSFSYGPSLALAASRIEGPDPRAAALDLVDRARREITGRILGQEGDYLLLFAWFHHDLGNDHRTRELLDGIQLRNSPYSAVILDHRVRGWPRSEWIERSRDAARRVRDLAEIRRRTELNPVLLAEELEHWTA